MKCFARLGWAFGLVFGLACVPLSAQITPESFALAARYSRAHGGEALRVIQHDRVIFENYAEDFDEDTPHKIYSGTKNIVALAMLVAIERDHLFSGWDEPIGATLHEWQNDRRGSITLRQLLTQTSGLDRGFEQLYPARDQLSATLHIPLIDPPGTRFHYGASGYQIAGEMLKRKLRARDESVEDYLHATVLDKIGIDVSDWVRDRAGQPLLHSGLLLSSRQWGKLGVFLLHQLRTPSPDFPDIHPLLQATAVNPAYGISFWLNVPEPADSPQKIQDLQLAIDGDQIYPGGPSDLFACIGSARQRLYMIPSLDLVIVRFGYDAPFSDGDFLSRLITGKPHPDAHTH